MAVRAPEGKRIRAIEINGKAWKDFDATAERIRLPVKQELIEITVRY